MSFSRYLQRALLDHVFLTAPYSQPSGVYVALYESDPGETNSGTEASGINYARVQHNSWAAASDASPSEISNDGAIEFSEPGSGGWGTVSHFALFDASTGGNMLGYGALSNSKTIEAGDYVMFKSGDLVVTLD